jgi:hypothetical protein
MSVQLRNFEKYKLSVRQISITFFLLPPSVLTFFERPDLFSASESSELLVEYARRLRQTVVFQTETPTKKERRLNLIKKHRAPQTSEGGV